MFFALLTTFSLFECHNFNKFCFVSVTQLREHWEETSQKVIRRRQNIFLIYNVSKNIKKMVQQNQIKDGQNLNKCLEQESGP